MYVVKSMFISVDTTTIVSGLNLTCGTDFIVSEAEQEPPIWKTEEMLHFLKTESKKEGFMWMKIRKWWLLWRVFMILKAIWISHIRSVNKCYLIHELSYRVTLHCFFFLS